MTSLASMTYGEFWFLKYREVYMDDGVLVPFDERVLNAAMPKRLSRDKASLYYTNKIRSFFGLHEKMDRYEFRSLGFESIEDYYDFHEAQRHLKKVIS